MRDKVILLVEDNPDDVKLAMRAFRMQRIPNPVVVAHDGVAALDYLFGAGNPDNAPPLPALVLLDLKLPRLNGLETLQKIRASARTRYLPVVVLTTSSEESDVLECYRLGANSYLRKPVDFEEFSAVIGRLGFYWLNLNLAPPFSPMCL